MIFCQVPKQCALVYSAFKESLADDLCVNKHVDSKMRMVEMFHAGTPKAVKKHILCNISQPNGLIGIIACTAAFGMGVDCKEDHRVKSWSRLSGCTPLIITPYFSIFLLLTSCFIFFIAF